MTKQPSRIFLAVFIGMVLVATGLISSIPALFGTHEPFQAWVTAALTGLFVALAAATLFLRPARPNSTEPDRNE